MPETLTFGDIQERLRVELEQRYETGDRTYVWIHDMSDEFVFFGVEGDEASIDAGTYRLGYTKTDAGEVSLAAGEPEAVERRTTYEVSEAEAREPGRVLEARDDNADGGRVFHVRIIESGDSKNGRRYPLGVLHAAASMYDGAKAFDHHRTPEEITTSTVDGLVGYYRDVQADDTGLVADLHLLPGATHVAECFDASLAAQEAGGPPIAGISHDVLAEFKASQARGSRVLEATKIVRVLSADVVADPSAGGKAIRMVAGGDGETLGNDTTEEHDMPKTLAELLAEATPDDLAALKAQLAEDPEAGSEASTTETEEPAGEPSAEEPSAEPAEEEEKVLVAAESFHGRAILREAVADHEGLTVEMLKDLVGDRFTEADVAAAVKQYIRLAEAIEQRNLTPTVAPGAIRVTEEALDKTKERVYQTLCRNWQEGYTSFFEMFEDITGQRIRPDADGAALIVRESWDAARISGARATESIGSTTWGEILGDSITRRLIEMYRRPNYGTWRKIARTTPVRDFREQKRDRMGGYGNLPTVTQGDPYQPLTSPTDEEATYSVAKRGGTEDLTWEAVMNDDLGAIARIPEALGRAAARTLHEFVWLDLFQSNPTCSYDSVALFAAGHGNTESVALSHSAINTLRRKMRDQAEYGVAGKPLGIRPACLIVPNELEDLAHQICTSAVAIPSTTPGSSDVPNLHQTLEPIVVDEFTDATEFFLTADVAELPVIEVGFLNGREDPELFMQDDPRVGAVFSSDKVTWKIRHVYSGAVLDHRAAQRGT